MHVRIRIFGKPDAVVVVESKLTKIEQFRRIIRDKFDVQPKLQRLFYGGKLLEDGYTFHDYNIKLNDVIQLMVRVQPDDSSKQKEAETSDKENKPKQDCADKNVEYKDAESTIYRVGDLIDMRDREYGAWFEGKITRIVYDPAYAPSLNDSANSDKLESDSTDNDKESDENKPPSDSTNSESLSKNRNKGIAKYFSKTTKPVRKKQPEKEIKSGNNKESLDSNLLYKIQLEAEEEDSNLYCKLHEIRPRARTVIAIKDVKVGQKVMINYNTDEPLERGYWYDLKVSEIKKLRVNYELVGTLYLGADAVTQNDTKVRLLDKIFAIEEPVPLAGELKNMRK